MNRFLFVILTVILLSMLVISGCAKQAPAPAPTTTLAPAPTPKTAPATTAAPQYGGILKIIIAPGPTNLGYPAEGRSGNDIYYGQPCVEGLTSLDPKGTGLSVPCLATGWQYSPDYTSLTFTLRKGVKFHDGTDFNAEAAKYNLDMSRSGVRGTTLKSVTSIAVIDDYTIRLNLSAFEPGLISNFLTPGVDDMLSPTALKTMGKECMLHPVGTGPFKFASFQRDVSLKFAKWDGYWQKGKPYLDGIEWVFVTDPTTALLSFKTGDAQVIRDPSTKDASDLKATGKYTIVTTPGGVAGLLPDSAHPGSPFADIGVRRAIAYAIDNEAIAKAVGYGINPAAYQLAAIGTWSYNPAVAGYPYNPQKAKDLLLKAGYPKGFATELIFDAGKVVYRDTAAAVQAYLREVGIDAKLTATDKAKELVFCTDGWNSSLLGPRSIIPVSIGTDPIAALIDRLSSKAFRIDPKSVYSPADYETKLFQANTERDPKKRQEMTQEIMKMIIDDYCMVIPIFLETGLLAKSANVQDLDFLQYGTIDWHAENAWLSK